MMLQSWFRLNKPKRALRLGETLDCDVRQEGNRVAIDADGLQLYFSVEGADLPPEADKSFAVWALMPFAMEQGFNIHINHPVDPKVLANAEQLSRIWEMWVPSEYRSVKVSGESGWSRVPRQRLPRIDLFSGGIDSTYSLLKQSDPQRRGYALTFHGFDYRREGEEERFAKLLAKTEPLLESLNYERIVIRTNTHPPLPGFTHGFTLATCLFLLGDLFEEGTIAADSTPAEDMATFPWGTNLVTNDYLAGSDFAMRTVASELGRTEKVAALAQSGLDLSHLSFCRRKDVAPANCGACGKCIRTKAMFLAVTGSIPEICIDNSLDERLLRKLDLSKRNERAFLFNLYGYAKDRDCVERIPGLARMIEECRKF